MVSAWLSLSGRLYHYEKIGGKWNYLSVLKLRELLVKLKRNSLSVGWKKTRLKLSPPPISIKSIDEEKWGSKERMRIRGEIFKTWKRKWQCWLLARLKTVSSLPVPSGHFPLPFLLYPSRHPLFPTSHHLQCHLTARDSAREGGMPQRGHTVDWQEGRLVEETSGQAPSHTHPLGSSWDLYRSFSLLVLTLLICVSDSSICLVHPSTDLPPRPPVFLLTHTGISVLFSFKVVITFIPSWLWTFRQTTGTSLVTFKLKWKKCVCIYCSIAHGGERSPGSLFELSVSSYRNIWQWG